MGLGEIIKELLDLHGMTQKQLAEALALSSSALGNYVQGTREPDYHTLIRIADFFEVTTDYLLNHSAKTNSSYIKSNSSYPEASHREELLLHIFRSLTEDQQEFYLEQGHIFLRQNKKKESSLLSSAQRSDTAVS